MIRRFTFVFVLAFAGLAMADEPLKKAVEKPLEKTDQAQATEQAAAEDAPAVDKDGLDLSTTQLKASYGIGVSIGKSIKADGFDVDLAALTEGLRHSLEGEKVQLTAPEIRAAITAFQQEMQIKLAARRQEQAEKNLAEGKEFLAKNGTKAGIVTLESGLQYEVLKKGKGKQPTAEDTVKTHYHGTLLDGTVFDSSVESGEPISFGVKGVIAGWTEALQLMKEGDKWRLFVPSELAYQDRGVGGDIGPNATLIFEVELLEVE